MCGRDEPETKTLTRDEQVSHRHVAGTIQVQQHAGQKERRQQQENATMLND
jgi:hypothetical protein